MDHMIIDYRYKDRGIGFVYINETSGISLIAIILTTARLDILRRVGGPGLDNCCLTNVGLFY